LLKNEAFFLYENSVINITFICLVSIIFAAVKIVSSILSLLLIAIILFNSLRVSFTYAYYYADTAGFIERLCENKDKVEMQCNGKCHLKKVTQDNSANDDKVPFKDINFKEITLYVVTQNTFSFINALVKKNKVSAYNNLYAYSIDTSLDHPPQF